MNEFRQTLSSITRNLTKASGELIKTTKINLSISAEEDRLKSVYVDIGKKVHEIYLYGGGLGKFFDEKYLEICEVEKKLSELRGQLNAASGTRPCPKCKRAVEKSAEFCSKCGTKMDTFDIPKGGYTDSDFTVELQETPTSAMMPPYQAEKQESVVPDSVIINTVSQPKAAVCKACYAECAPGDKYCLSCGRML